nr:NAD(P)(+) transhydrogenase (Re/Si-specific) subunit beta [Chamaesiphon sp. VAR_48_metabat_135_sub]
MNINEFIPTGIQISYLVSTALFFIGLKYLGSPATARKGNTIAAVGMLIAVVGTLLNAGVINYSAIFLSIAIGSAIGAIGAYKVSMTEMPQMVGLLNGLGGGASTLIAVAEFLRVLPATEVPSIDSRITLILSILIGGITLTGSLIAFAKLQELMSGSPITFPLQQPVNILLFASFVVGSSYFLTVPKDEVVFLGLTAISLILGVLFVLPIGGADMPVVVSLLNSFSGIAAAAAGFVLMNNILIIAGALVGASGIILTQIMCKGMNRSLSSVLFGAFGGVKSGKSNAGGAVETRTARSVDAEECAMMLGYAQSVVIVPGYGMAVAQAQHTVRELADQLDRLGVEVKYAIHPVAGRMPGHMNVLLAEANVPYPQLYDMDDINPQFDRVDVALVIGANDVVNPAARTDSNSPIFGMPILDVDKAKHTIVIKRGMSTGFAGVENELFYLDKTMMLFGSAKDVVGKLVAEIKQL